MRVITGSARGMRLTAPLGENTRPTADIVKEAVFSVIQFEVEGAKVLDLFAGSGQMGIEALSRGARHCVFVDSARECHSVQVKNLDHTRLKDKARLVGGDVIAYLQKAAGSFDIVFLDPPYGQGLPGKVLPLLPPLVSENGVIFVETAKGEDVPEHAGDFLLRKQYRFGKTMVTLYRRPDKDALHRGESE